MIIDDNFVYKKNNNNDDNNDYKGSNNDIDNVGDELFPRSK